MGTFTFLAFFRKPLWLAAVFCLALAGSAGASNFVSQGIDPVYSFTGNDGSFPSCALIQASDGNFYGTTQDGGTNGYGNIFRVGANGTLVSIYDFTNGIDGALPFAGLVQANNGILYGTTLQGGTTNGNGAIFQITTNGVFRALYQFTGGLDGANPYASLVQASDGNLYGTAIGGGGLSDNGVIFRISTGGTFHALYQFTGGDDGAAPNSGLVQGKDGFLYGTAAYGGLNNNGTIYQFSTNGSLNTIYEFMGGNDGANPVAGLIQGADGSFYGTAQNGGFLGAGTVFQASVNGGLAVLYSFTDLQDGGEPMASVVQGKDGYLYGTTPNGGPYANGTVFRLSTNGLSFNTLCAFTGGNDGANPQAALLLASNGLFYGTAPSGGALGNGTVFALDALQIVPRDSVIASPAGAPVPAASLDVLNLSGSTISWGVAVNSPLVLPSPANGVLAPGASAPLTVNFSTTAASEPPGAYPLGLLFSNLTANTLQSAALTVEAQLAPVVSFPGIEGQYPTAPLIQGSDGNFYGTTYGGGNDGEGTIFTMNSNGVLRTLYSFTGANDGAMNEGNYFGLTINSFAGLVQAADGNLYGTTEFAGASGFGTVFRITTTGLLTTLYSFTGAEDGGSPAAGLLQAADGNFYGTTSGGDLFGTIFRINTNGALTTLYSFTGANDGAFPLAPLIQTADGNLYGTASAGGVAGWGTVFRVTTTGLMTPLFSFNDTDGSSPTGGLVRAADGYLYGTAASGGDTANGGVGTAFRISTNGAFNVVHLFTGESDGESPYAGLVLASNGNLYGTASRGGGDSVGTVFEISTNGTFAQLHQFLNNDGGYPEAPLIQARDGYLYGTASAGGSNNNGTVFKMTLAGALTPLHLFAGATSFQAAGGLLASGGNFYGVTDSGGPNDDGAIYEAAPDGTFGYFYSFDTASPGGPQSPQSAPIQARDGNFYGTTEYGGTFGDGLLYEISQSGTFTPIHDFSGSADGSDPVAPLIQATDGYFYGTTQLGGSNGDGTIFKASRNSLTPLFYFAVNINGAYPVTPLVQATDGYLYGTTSQGPGNQPTVYKISTNGQFTFLASFNYNIGAGVSGLVQGVDGYLYGTAFIGGSFGEGTVFQISTDAKTFVPLYSFTGEADGSHPFGGLVQAPNGDLYGVTEFGGASGLGTVFQVSTSGTFTSLYSFSGGADGAYPDSGLTIFDGYLYGTTQSGADGNGDIYRILIPTSGAAPVIIDPLGSGVNAMFTFETVAGQSYTVQQNTNLSANGWLIYTNITGTGQPFQWTIPPSGPRANFFRVTEP